MSRKSGETWGTRFTELQPWNWLGYEQEAVKRAGGVDVVSVNFAVGAVAGGKCALAGGSARAGDIAGCNGTSGGALEAVIDAVRINVNPHRGSGRIYVLRFGTLSGARTCAGHVEDGKGAAHCTHVAVKSTVRV